MKNKKETVTGTVKKLVARKGYGFITRDDGKGDVFFHVRGVTVSLLPYLKEGMRVRAEVVRGDRGPKAQHVAPEDREVLVELALRKGTKEAAIGVFYTSPPGWMITRLREAAETIGWEIVFEDTGRRIAGRPNYFVIQKDDKLVVLEIPFHSDRAPEGVAAGCVWRIPPEALGQDVFGWRNTQPPGTEPPRVFGTREMGSNRYTPLFLQPKVWLAEVLSEAC